MSPPSRAFVETTAVADIALSGEARRVAAEAARDRYSESVTSTFVLTEFSRGPLQHWIYAHEVFRSVDAFSAGMERLSRVAGAGYRIRKLSSALTATADAIRKALADGGLRGEDQDAALCSAVANQLALVIDDAWQRAAGAATRTLQTCSSFDGSGPPRRYGDGTYQHGAPPTLAPRRDLPPDVVAYLQLHRDRLEKLQGILKSLVDENNPSVERRAEAVARLVRAARGKPKKVRCDALWAAGDEMVTLEVGEDTACLTSNERDFGPILEPLGIPMEVYGTAQEK